MEENIDSIVEERVDGAKQPRNLTPQEIVSTTPHVASSLLKGGVRDEVCAW